MSAPVAVKVAVLPRQTLGELFVTASVGVPELTVIVITALVIQLEGLIAVNVYEVVTIGEIKIDGALLPVLQV